MCVVMHIWFPLTSLEFFKGKEHWGSGGWHLVGAQETSAKDETHTWKI